MEWYPRNPDLLKKALSEYMEKPQEINEDNTDKTKTPEIPDKINGLIVPHAGYMFSGSIAGKAFKLLENKKPEKVIIIAPSHYESFKGIKSIEEIETPLGRINITENEYPKIKYEHAIDNQIPFLQKLEVKEVLPLVIGELDENQIKETTEKILEEFGKNPNTVLIVSTDLSHFLDDETAKNTDKTTIEAIEKLDAENPDKIDACGKYPLQILMEICRQKEWQPQLIEYKNSGDIIGDKSKVVGYASFCF